MSLSILFLFAATALVLIATPGPTVLLALSNGMNHGLRPSLFGVAGAIASDLVLIAAVFLGMGAMLAMSETAFLTVKWFGVAYLFYLGVCAFRQGGAAVSAEPIPGAATTASGRKLFMKSFLVAVGNPKGLLFFSAFLPQFVDPASPQLPQYVVLGLVFAVLDCVVMFSYAAAGVRAQYFLRNAAAVRWFNRACGGLLVSMAGGLALYRRAS
jgi:threonine/homoserine/homoserine lactone efflux protein